MLTLDMGGRQKEAVQANLGKAPVTALCHLGSSRPRSVLSRPWRRRAADRCARRVSFREPPRRARRGGHGAGRARARGRARGRGERAHDAAKQAAPVGRRVRGAPRRGVAEPHYDQLPRRHDQDELTQEALARVCVRGDGACAQAPRSRASLRQGASAVPLPAQSVIAASTGVITE